MYKVLLVDDEPLILNGLAEFIRWEQYGLEISGKAMDGLEALEIIDRKNIHILITDIRMPRMDGLELIRHIAEHRLPVKCIVLSGYNDFGYLKEAAKLGIENYLLKPVDEKELIPTLLNITQKLESEARKKVEAREGISIIRDNILLRWVSGDIDGEELLQRASLIDIEIGPDEFCVAAVRILDSMRTGGTFKDTDRRLLRFAVQNICHQIVSENGLGISFPDLNGDVILLFKGERLKENKSRIRQLLTACIENINSCLKYNAAATVGHVEHQYLSVYRSYKQAHDLQEYSAFTNEKSVLFYEDFKLFSVSFPPGTAIDFDPLDLAIRKRDKEAVRRSVHDLIIRLPAADSRVLEEFSFMLLTHLLGVFKNHTTTRDLKLISTQSRLGTTLQDLEQNSVSLIYRYFDSLSEVEDNMHPLVRKVIDFAKKHYTEDINLKTIAAEFDVNAFYLGQLFSKDTGSNFTHYLNTMRVEEAKSLLRSTPAKANQVARMVGYFNTNYFSTLFKKMTGMTPTEFKGE